MELGKILSTIAVHRHGDPMVIRLKTLKFDLHGRRNVLDVKSSRATILTGAPISAKLSFSSKRARVRWERQLSLFIADPTSVSAEIESAVEVCVTGPGFDGRTFEPDCGLSLDVRLDPTSGEPVRSLVILNTYGAEYASVSLSLSHDVVLDPPSRLNAFTLRSDAKTIDLCTRCPEPGGEPDMYLLAGWLRTPYKHSSGSYKIYDELETLTLYSTGKPGHPKRWCLDVKEDNLTSIQLGGRNLGPADALVLACWLCKSNVREALTELDLSNNWIFGRRFKTEVVAGNMRGHVNRLLAKDATQANDVYQRQYQRQYQRTASLVLATHSNQSRDWTPEQVELEIRYQMAALVFGCVNADLTSQDGSFSHYSRTYKLDKLVTQHLYERVQSILFNLNMKGQRWVASPQLRCVAARRAVQQLPDPKATDKSTPLKWVTFDGSTPLYPHKHQLGGKALPLDDNDESEFVAEDCYNLMLCNHQLSAAGRQQLEKMRQNRQMRQTESTPNIVQPLAAVEDQEGVEDAAGGVGWETLANAIMSCPNLMTLHLGELGEETNSRVVLAPLEERWAHKTCVSNEPQEGCCTYS